MAATVIPLRATRSVHLRRGRRKLAPQLDLAPIEVKSPEGWRYQWHRLILQRGDLTRSEIAVAGVLMHASDSVRQCAEIALTTLAKRAGCSRRAAVTVVLRLRDLGLIVAVNEGQRIRGNRRWRRIAIG